MFCEPCSCPNHNVDPRVPWWPYGVPPGVVGSGLRLNHTNWPPKSRAFSTSAGSIVGHTAASTTAAASPARAPPQYVQHGDLSSTMTTELDAVLRRWSMFIPSGGGGGGGNGSTHSRDSEAWLQAPTRTRVAVVLHGLHHSVGHNSKGVAYTHSWARSFDAQRRFLFAPLAALGVTVDVLVATPNSTRWTDMENDYRSVASGLFLTHRVPFGKKGELLLAALQLFARVSATVTTAAVRSLTVFCGCVVSAMSSSVSLCMCSSLSRGQTRRLSRHSRGPTRA
jgi:hypothetical protein